MTRNFVAAALTCLLGVSASGAPIYSTTFTGTDGTQPTGWTVFDQTAAIENNEYKVPAPAVSGTTMRAYAGYDQPDGYALTDYVVRSKIKIGPQTAYNNRAGVLARYNDLDNFYWTRIYRPTGMAYWRFQLYSRVAGVWTNLDEHVLETQYPADTWYEIELTVQGTSTTARLYDENGNIAVGTGGETELTGTENLLTSGTFGVAGESKFVDSDPSDFVASIYFDDLAVSGLIAGVPGDTDGDGDVDLDDLFAVRNNFGATSGATTADGDVNPFPGGDGDVDLDDLFMIRNNFGTTTGAVPEPATVSLFGLGLLAIIRHRKQ